jgi:hypothetical protein
VTVTATFAVFVLSATERTTIVAEPTFLAVMTQPGLVTDATVVSDDWHVTPAFISGVEPEIVVMIVCVWPGFSETADGTAVTVTAGRVTVRTADADLVGSPTDVAVITVVPDLFFAVTTPVVALTVATVVSDEVKVLAVFALPVTVATKVNVSPALIDAEDGVIETAV